ncbi:MAG: cysteine hydrolase family protein [Myxococcota bacterium]
MPDAKTAVLLIGFQNDYFADDGVLRAVVQQNATANGVLKNTLALLDELQSSDALFITLPILFSPNYSELPRPTGLLATIKELGAFRRDTVGGQTVPDFTSFGDRIETITGKTSFNAFFGTNLHERLTAQGITDLVLCGVVTSVCIDSTGRAAAELGYGVTVLSDCTAGRSAAEHTFYCEDIFPLYAQVQKSSTLLRHLHVAA